MPAGRLSVLLAYGLVSLLAYVKIEDLTLSILDTLQIRNKSFRLNLLNHSFFKNEIVKRIGKSAIWCLSGEMIGRGSSVLAGFLAARILEVNGFGQLGMIRSTVGTFNVFAGFGLGVTTRCFMSKYMEMSGN